MLVLGAVIHQQHEARRGHTVGQYLQPGLGLAVQPVQILHQEEHGLVAGFAQQQPRDRLERPLPSDLRVHLHQRCRGRCHAQEGQQVGQRLFQAAIEREHLTGDLFLPGALIVLGGDLHIVLQQLNQRQIRRRLAMRDGEGLQHQSAALGEEVKLIAQARFSHPRLPHHRDDLPMPLPGSRPGPVQVLQLALAADKAHQPAAGRHVQARPQWPHPHDLIDVHRRTDPVHLRRARRLEGKIPLG